ncbi:MAG: methyltransferase domain-containing protein [Rhodospirillales bacterium]|jgi:SAM-dependent methyltransferase|nr:SAM-dependent methyltransferase [Rhodospirillaceae bacterium]MDP6426838.1 methyltransferase domain-containing protein [Rhodospirillales bacterium]MDP6643426.1 methyltransferase domain-containing protein [Rhodospirillales bacterium]|tara:strand:+ start:72 stop:746 length:675 start_codon:yes stop_codon:yes gene_type:complete
MKECSKSIMRRLRDPNFANRYFAGSGLDIGGAPDPLGLYVELFPRMRGVRTFDREDGDAQALDGIEDGAMDFVHSSHCLEHMADPTEALQNWFRATREGGHLIVTVPDEDLYEQGQFPSTWNGDHKHTFTIFKTHSWSDKSINLVDLIQGLGAAAEVARLNLLDEGFRHTLPRFDQTMTPIGECGIEFVIRRRTNEELEAGGRKPPAGVVSPMEFALLTGFQPD